ncbi:hypothetical protein FJTKL_13703 [Diaporthe vaccinii]|uniref:Uncharacterized protein n=1 Tax=Diaporthe vaccinii TaxID=105482 RepID=A0ABR4E9P4_9PEZI
MLGFVHFQVGETGRNKWLWKKLKAAHIFKCCQYEFDWGYIYNEIVYERKGRSLAKKITTEGPQPRGRRASRTQIGPKRDRAKFQRRILHVYQGTNEDGVAVYKTYHDRFLTSDAALE